MAKEDNLSTNSSEIPIPIQSFLWGQIDPFVRQKGDGRFQRSCSTWESVLVDFKLEHWPNSLSEAIKSISRWQFIDACLPHLMQCCALMLTNRNTLGDGDKLGAAATKLLYTLHWTFLEAPQKCAINHEDDCIIELERVGLFIHLFAPIVGSLKESDLTFRLESGLQIWQPMWNFEEPRIPSFTATINAPNLEKTANSSSSLLKSGDSLSSRLGPVNVCDVAVLKCLHYHRWCEDGVLWGITYIFKKLQMWSGQCCDNFKHNHRRSQSLVDRRRFSSMPTSIRYLPFQTENRKESNIEGKQESSNLTGFLKDPRIQKKMSPLVRFRSRRSQNSMKKTKASPIAERRNRIKSFAPISSFKTRTFRLKKHSTFGEDRPPSYIAVTRDKKTLHDRRKTMEYKKPITMDSECEIETLFSISPPQYDDASKTDENICNIPSTSDYPNITVAGLRTSCISNKGVNEGMKRRWISDSCLTNKKDKPSVASLVSSKYVNSDGGLRIDVVLSVVDVIISKKPSVRIQEICVQVLTCIYEQKQISKEKPRKSFKSQYKEVEIEENKSGEIFVKVLYKFIQLLGCSNACSTEGHRNNSHQRIRLKIRHLMVSLFPLYRKLYGNFLLNALQTKSLGDLINFLHAFLSYCDVDTLNNTVKEVTEEALLIDLKSSSKMEDFIIQLMFGEIINKCVQTGEALEMPENEDLYAGVRNFIQFVRANHSSTFNEILLSVMIVPSRKRAEWEIDKGGNLQKSVSNNPSTSRYRRRGGINFDRFSLDCEKGSQGLDLHKARDALSFRTSNLGSRFRNSDLGSKRHEDASSDNDDYEDLTSRRKSHSMFDRIWKKTRDYTGLCKSEKLKKINENESFLTDTIMTDKKVNENESKENEVKKEEFEVAPEDIYNGVKVLEFLMKSSSPGSVPDAAVLGSVIGLKSPVISRCVVLLQCAQYVRRCASRDWPGWIRNLGSQKNQPQKHFEEHIHSIAKVQFHKWGLELNKFLEKVIATNNDPSKVLGDVKTQEEKSKNRTDDMNEDFLKDARVSPSGKECPVALQMAASNLLREITTFLKDSTSDVVKKESILNFDQAYKYSLASAPNFSSKCDEILNRKTIKFQSASDIHHPFSLNVPGFATKRATSLAHNNLPVLTKEPITRRSSSATNGSEESTIMPLLSTQRGGRAASVSASSNTLMVPTGNVAGGDGIIYESYGSLSFGSTYSLGAASATSEYVKDIGDAGFSPHCCLCNSSLFSLNSYQAMNSVIRCKDIPWLKTMIQLASQQNFSCKHTDFCHPYCYKRMIRSCNRIVETLFNIMDKFDEIEDRTSTNETNQNQLARFIKSEAGCLVRSPLQTLLKSVTSLSFEMLIDIHTHCWEILLDSDRLLVESAAALFLLCAIKIRSEVHNTIMLELNHKETKIRMNAIRKIRVLWEHRKCVWNLAENQARENKETGFIFQAANSSFGLSLSTLGIASSSIPDPPWKPHTVNVDQMLAQKGSLMNGSAAIITTDTLSCQKEQEIKQLLRQEEEERAKARRNYPFTTIPILQHVIAEAKKKTNSESHSGGPNKKRRLSTKPVHSGSNQSNADCGKDAARLSRASIIHNALRSLHADTTCNESVPRPNSSVFPPSIGDCIPTVLLLMGDVSTTTEGQSVGSLASWVVVSCLNEEPNLFIRTVSEKLQNKQELFKGLWIIEKLPILLPNLSSSVANSLFSLVIDCVIHYHRASRIKECIVAPSTCTLASVLPMIEGVDYKILRQSLRTHQIDLQLIITAGMHGTKKLVLLSEYDYYAPNQIEVGDQTSFAYVLQEAINTRSIPESEQRSYQIIDDTTQQVLCQHCYVRDVFIFRKSAYPEIKLVKMGEEGETKLCERVIDLKLIEIGRLIFIIGLLQGQKQWADKELNATYIQDDLKRLWSFPRKAIDAEFFLFDSKYGKEVKCLDAIQKYHWTDLISLIMLTLPNEFSWENNSIFFLHVLNASLVIHCEYAPLLRRIMAAFIDSVVYFGRTFTLHGYSLILPSMLRVYSKHYQSKIIRKSLSFVFYQMLNVHRQPFLLQLFASAAPLLAEYTCSKGSSVSQDLLFPADFFNLLLSLIEEVKEDEFKIMSLVKADRPLKPADTCLETDKVKVTFGDYFRLCVTVIAYQPENGRMLEMLIILNNVLPCYLHHIQINLEASEELSQIYEVAEYVCFLLSNIETLTKSFNFHCSVQQNDGLTEDEKTKEENNEKRYMSDEFVVPRNILLHLCTTFYTTAMLRISQLKKPLFHDIFDSKCHLRLAEVAQSLFKLFTDEGLPSVSIELAYYIEKMLPVVDWSNEASRPALFMVLKRLDKFLARTNKSYTFRQSSAWTSLTMIINGLCSMLVYQPVLSHIPHLKGFVKIIVSMQAGTVSPSSNHVNIQQQCNINSNLTTSLTQKVMRLIVLQTQGGRDDSTLQELLSPLLGLGNRTSALLNIVIPICLSTLADVPLETQNELEVKKYKLAANVSSSDVLFLLKVCTDALMGKQNSQKFAELIATASPRGKRPPDRIVEQKVFCLSLKVLIMCFCDRLRGQWQHLARTLRDIINSQITGFSLWNFVVFLFRYKTPLLPFLKTFVVRQFIERSTSVQEELEQKKVLLHILKSRDHKPIQLSLLVKDFAEEAQELRKQLNNKNSNDPESSKIAHCIPRSPNITCDVQERDRSRKTSFRKAVLPAESPESLGGFTDEYQMCNRKSLTTVKNKEFSKPTPSTSECCSESNIQQNKLPVSTGVELDSKKSHRVPDIFVDSYETPKSSPKTSKWNVVMEEFHRSRSATSSSKESSKSFQKLGIKSKTAGFLGKSNTNKDQQYLAETREECSKMVPDCKVFLYDDAKQTLRDLRYYKT